jgi:carbon monoxide dehydrogenase subunit G
MWASKNLFIKNITKLWHTIYVVTKNKFQMKSSKIIVASVFTGFLFISSCSDSFWNCIEGNGATATVRRVTGDFTNVANHGDFIVDVTIGTPTSVSVEADEDLLSYIETYIQGNTLIIETEDNHCLQSHEQIYVKVVTPSVYELKMSGSGVINCNNVDADELKYVLSGSGSIQSTGIVAGFIDTNISGSGEIMLSGTAAQSSLSIPGSGDIKALNLEQDKCIATISGSGTIYAFVNDNLDVQISGSGNVVYKGDPAIVVNVTGSGRVIRY